MPPRNRIEKQCLECGKTYETVPSKALESKFCSKTCRAIYHGKHRVEHVPGGPRRKYDRGAETHRKPGKKRPKDGLCKVCGRKLGEYNKTDQCHHHSVLDPYQNEDWHPDGVKGGVAYDVGLVW